MKSKITILGAGNMGTLLAAKFSKRGYQVCVYLNEVEAPDGFDHDIVVHTDNNVTYTARIDKITTDLKEAIDYGNIVFIIYPSFLFEKYARLVFPYVKQGQHFFILPGSGGAELQFKEFLSKGATLTGLQRVHSVARLIKRGKEVQESGVRNLLYIASIPSSYNSEAKDLIESLYDIPVECLDNYLNITLVNSNPILHTSRLYTIFKDFGTSQYNKKELPLFYEQWDLPSSELLVKMDEELFSLIDKMRTYNINVNHIESLIEHYDSTNAVEMTKKLCSIDSLKRLTTPSIMTEKGILEPDLSSRYFTADFPFGLDILLSFCEFFKIDAQNMKKVSDWYHKITSSKRTFNVSKYFDSIDSFKQFYN